MKNNKIKLEDLIREIDLEQRKGPELDMKKIAAKAEEEMKQRENRSPKGLCKRMLRYLFGRKK